LWCGKYIRNLEFSLDPHLLSSRGESEFNSRGGTMQDCESLLICHLCIHRYKSIDIDECAEAERSRDGGGVMEQCLNDHEYESSDESVHPTPPYSVDVQWDGLEDDCNSLNSLNDLNPSYQCDELYTSSEE
jgi:hypothetical protein